MALKKTQKELFLRVTAVLGIMSTKGSSLEEKRINEMTFSQLQTDPDVAYQEFLEATRILKDELKVKDFSRISLGNDVNVLGEVGATNMIKQFVKQELVVQNENTRRYSFK